MEHSSHKFGAQSKGYISVDCTLWGMCTFLTLLRASTLQSLSQWGKTELTTCSIWFLSFGGGGFVINYRCDEATHSSKEEVKGKVGKRMEVELNNGKMETWHSSSSAWQILNSPQAFQQRPEASNLTKTSHSAIIIYYYMKVKNDPQWRVVLFCFLMCKFQDKLCMNACFCWLLVGSFQLLSWASDRLRLW